MTEHFLCFYCLGEATKFEKLGETSVPCCEECWTNPQDLRTKVREQLEIA